MAHARPVSLYGESVMTRFNEVEFVSGAEHSKDVAGLGMKWDFLDIPLGFDLGDGDGEGEIDGDVLLRRFTFNDA